GRRTFRLESDQGAGQAFRIHDARVSLNEPAALAARVGRQCNLSPAAQEGEEDRRNPMRRCLQAREPGLRPPKGWREQELWLPAPRPTGGIQVPPACRTNQGRDTWIPVLAPEACPGLDPGALGRDDSPMNLPAPRSDKWLTAGGRSGGTKPPHRSR